MNRPSLENRQSGFRFRSRVLPVSKISSRLGTLTALTFPLRLYDSPPLCSFWTRNPRVRRTGLVRQTNRDGINYTAGKGSLLVINYSASTAEHVDVRRRLVGRFRYRRTVNYCCSRRPLRHFAVSRFSRSRTTVITIKYYYYY